MLVVRVKTPADVPWPARGNIQITVVKTARLLHLPTLAAFARESYLRSLQADSGWVTGPPRAITLNGLPALRYSGRITNSFTILNYVILDGRFVYTLDLMANTKQWPSVAASLQAVAQTFRVTK